VALLPSFIPQSGTINSAISNFLDGGSVGMETIRNIEYDAQYLWVVDFNHGTALPPEPFSTWFPANNVNFQLANLETEIIITGQDSFKIPKGGTPKEVTVTFYDNNNRDLLRWITDWIEIDIKNRGYFMSALKDNHAIVGTDGKTTTKGLDSFGKPRKVQPVRQIKLSLLDKYKRTIKTYGFFVFPEGVVNYEGSHSSEATQYTVTFNIVGVSVTNDEKPEGFESIKAVISRFI
jgi:hypothetical protein